jgi:hypothetical protein
MLSEEEKKLFRLYGKLPTHKDVLGNKLKVSTPGQVMSLCMKGLALTLFTSSH